MTVKMKHSTLKIHSEMLVALKTINTDSTQTAEWGGGGGGESMQGADMGVWL